MDLRNSLFSLSMISISIVAAYLLVRKHTDEIISRVPLLIVCCLPFFYIGLVNLPLAVPGIFHHLLGHSVWVVYMPPAKVGETQEGGTWWLVRWLEPIRSAFFYVVLLGVFWAAFNVVRRRAWKLNAICIVVGAFLWAIHIFLSVTTLIG